MTPSGQPAPKSPSAAGAQQPPWQAFVLENTALLEKLLSPQLQAVLHPGSCQPAFNKAGI